MKAVLIVLSVIFASSGFAQDYWTPRREIETAAVTAFHAADVAQTCYRIDNPQTYISGHLIMTTRWSEKFWLTPNNCPGVAVAVFGESAVLQYASYRLARRWKRFERLDRAMPYIQIGMSIGGISATSTNVLKRGR